MSSKCTKTIKANIGKAFQQARLKAGLSQSMLARAMNIDVRTIQSWEQGRTFMADLEIIPTISEVIHFDVLKALQAELESLNTKKGKANGK